MAHLVRCLFKACAIASDEAYAEAIPREFLNSCAAHSGAGSSDHNDF
jgi:hypothetical protein